VCFVEGVVGVEHQDGLHRERHADRRVRRDQVLPRGLVPLHEQPLSTADLHRVLHEGAGEGALGYGALEVRPCGGSSPPRSDDQLLGAHGQAQALLALPRGGSLDAQVANPNLHGSVAAGNH
jgi:hypothetical protein